MGIILAIIIFSFIVFFHEFGHFILAKKNGIDVEEFAIGMGPALCSKEYKGTKYAIRLFPIGGYCAMGEDEAATDSPNNFNNKSVWARISVIAAGPIFNFILAFVFAVILTAMVGYDPPVVREVEQGYPAAEAGIQKGDIIVKMGNKKINIYREISIYNQFHQGEDVEITYIHDGKKQTVTLTPKMDEESGYTRIGITGSGNTKANIFTSIQYGVYEVKFWICTTLESLKMLITGQIGADQLSGPVGIVSVVDNTYQQSKSYGLFIVIAQMLNIAILLSANLGVMNLLPLPALDGGRLVFLFVEAIRRKRIPPEKEGYVHLVGIALLMVLMVFVMFNDIRRVFF
ncbi:RIP metalloprotease RseP [Bariatricus sp. SGI.161]|uniref:RIP metalloprotease RseP n=1 Tax=Bariatricus sp. SGI.161 TaxID=3420550 RepID=UPI002A76A6D1|nr:RIP metalloprotease RseP [Lachnospiraceae bacterium]MDY2612675.1 RIP metalloprotease RseP [Lachnospiraceae bacterium]MDY4208007.1 RIP metalloprotease RseP [Lachnospiraceae bacterium]